MTEAAIIRGLDWLKANQDPEGSWGGKDKDGEGNPKATNKDAMTGMALLAFLGHCELQDSPDYGPTVQKAINFLTSTLPTSQSEVATPVLILIPSAPTTLCASLHHDQDQEIGRIRKAGRPSVIKGQNESGGWAYAYGKGVAGSYRPVSNRVEHSGPQGRRPDRDFDRWIGRGHGQSGRVYQKMSGSIRKICLQNRKRGKPSLTGTGVLCLQIWKNAKSEEAKRPRMDRGQPSEGLEERQHLRMVLPRASLLSGNRRIGGSDFGEHGTRISSRSYAEPKHPTGIGRVENTIMENPIFTIRR